MLTHTQYKYLTLYQGKDVSFAARSTTVASHHAPQNYWKNANDVEIIDTMRESVFIVLNFALSVGNGDMHPPFAPGTQEDKDID